MTGMFWLSVVLRTALIAACGAGVWNAIFRRTDDMMNTGGIWYYTIQSNLWVLLMTAVYLALRILAQFTGAFPAIRFLALARFAVLVGITITFLVFWILLAPKMDKAYLLSPNNFLVHTAVPLLYIADFFLFDRGALIDSVSVLWCLAPPLFYFILTFLHAAIQPGIAFEGGGRYPYFFMDKDRFGWFGFRNGLGVFWWIFIFLGLTLGLGYFYRFMMNVI